MIALFNNTNMQWRAKINSQKSNYSEVSVSKKDKEGNVTVLKLTVPTDINIDALAESGNECVHSVYGKPSGLFYDNKNHRPTVSENAENKDIFLIGLDLKNGIVADMTRQDLFVIGYLISRGCLYMIASVKTGCKGFYITTYNRDRRLETKYEFEIGEDVTVDLANRTTVNVSTKQTKRSTEELFKIHTFRPSRATHLLYINNKDKALAESVAAEGKLFSMEKNNIVYFNDFEDLGEAVKAQLANGYTAASMFTDLTTCRYDQYGDYEDYIIRMRSAFDVNNIILGGVNPPIVIKR